MRPRPAQRRRVAALIAGLSAISGCSFISSADGGDVPPPVQPGTRSPAKPPKADPKCGPLTARFRPDQRFNQLFTSYANSNRLMNDWTGGDGTWSVPLPGGRTLWVIADSYLGKVHPPDRRHSAHWRDSRKVWFIRNTAIVQEAGGRLSATLTGHWKGSTSWIPEPGPNLRFEPGAGIVEPESAEPGAKQVLRITGFLKKGKGNGTVTRTVVVTVPLDTMKPRLPLTYLPAPKRRGPASWPFYGSSILSEGGWSYVYGGTTNDSTGQTAYLAKVPKGRLAEPSAWRYWSRKGWTRKPDRAAPILRPVGHGYNVIKVGGTYVMFTMDPTVHVGGFTQISTYWSCKRRGPWRGPHRVFRPPEPYQQRFIVTYNPHVNPQFWDSSGLLMHYEVNASWGHGDLKYDDVSLNRPRFLRARFVQP